MGRDEKHPILAGLLALVAVAVAVGIVVGVLTLAATHILGLGGSSSASASDAASLYLPSPSPTDTPSDPLVTLQATPSQSTTPSESPSSSPSASKKPKKPAKPKKKITLQSSQVSAQPMELFDLSGIYPGGEGAILRLQRKTSGGHWEDFGIPDVAVSGGEFSTQVQTGRTGKQMFRMKDIDSGAVSNVVTVTIG